MAKKALADGVIKFDEAQGYRGPVIKIDVAGDWGPKLADVRALTDIAPWRLAVVLDVNDQSARELASSRRASPAGPWCVTGRSATSRSTA